MVCAIPLGVPALEQAAVINEVYVAYGEREVAKDEAKKKKSQTNGVSTQRGES